MDKADEDPVAEVTQLLEANAAVSGNMYSTYRAHPLFSKINQNLRAKESQKNRRMQYLNDQKEKREKQLELLRKIGIGIAKSDADVEMEDVSVRLRKELPHERTVTCGVMESEWMVDVPDDLETNWLLVPCPMGKRCLLTANGKYCQLISRSNRKIRTIRCNLPAGSKLDCIWRFEDNIIYILDIIAWRNMPVTDCDTEFRFYWCNEKIKDWKEHTVMKNFSKEEYDKMTHEQRCAYLKSVSQIWLEVLPNFALDRATLTNTLVEKCWPFTCPVDGFLFYHKQSMYTPGITPLVGWLKPFMLGDVLKIPLPEEYCNTNGSTGVFQYIAAYEAKREAVDKHRLAKRSQEEDDRSKR
ncbi:Snurportin-1 [Trichinella pseudospiralis]|uniref:Snurportin-1 n=2 Tax=Trichinella pseudospiralis TaxID=6337 RepID=A0A0V1JGK5_TRIPS|nr:Snurportin-1 [Trichinella pseudospiralis]KRX95395.1 Snurportin-1 [Trichinella pseudospiralis]KRY68090.1 Snurportin-1 [Trichinella pseudospiralis]KRY83954.1 Snurportin-1 [Trichinella pseudospiralis]KRZ25227.1 Snurportin-1 [Trichinella pseudospiralis]